MKDQRSATRWANDIRQILRAALGHDGFPVDVARVAGELSRQCYPDDPIADVVGSDLPGFEGALIPDPRRRKGWLILYNKYIDSVGRIRFTVAHEFGHYLQHRAISPQGFNCKGDDFVRWDPAYRKLENDANIFAAGLLMPLDDFRQQIRDRDGVDFEILGNCADRYGVSLIAAALRWLQYTLRRAVVVLSRDGFVLWARSSDSALRSGLFIKSAKRTVEVPSLSLAARTALDTGGCRPSMNHPEGIWFPEECTELLLPSERYDFSISLLLFTDTLPDWDTQRANRAWGLGSRELKRDIHAAKDEADHIALS